MTPWKGHLTHKGVVRNPWVENYCSRGSAFRSFRGKSAWVLTESWALLFWAHEGFWHCVSAASISESLGGCHGSHGRAEKLLTGSPRPREEPEVKRSIFPATSPCELWHLFSEWSFWWCLWKLDTPLVDCFKTTLFLCIWTIVISVPLLYRFFSSAHTNIHT